jgi:hypothetical protein
MTGTFGAPGGGAKLYPPSLVVPVMVFSITHLRDRNDGGFSSCTSPMTMLVSSSAPLCVLNRYRCLRLRPVVWRDRYEVASEAGVGNQ